MWLKETSPRILFSYFLIDQSNLNHLLFSSVSVPGSSLLFGGATVVRGLECGAELESPYKVRFSCSRFSHTVFMSVSFPRPSPTVLIPSDSMLTQTLSSSSQVPTSTFTSHTFLYPLPRLFSPLSPSCGLLSSFIIHTHTHTYPHCLLHGFGRFEHQAS